MSLLQHPLLEKPLNNLNEFYLQEIVPRLTKKNKVIAITAAIVFLFSYKVNQVLRPPRRLRHLPHQGYFDFLASLFKRESPLERAQRYSLPLLSSEENNGLYLRAGRFGWEVQVSNPEAVRKVFLKTDLFPKDTAGRKHTKSLGYKFFGGPNILTLNGHAWKEQRKIANPAFHRSMPVHMFGKLTQDLFVEMDKMGERIEISDLMERWTLDAIGKAGFDFDFHAVRDRENSWVNTYNSITNGMVDPLFGLFPSLETYFLWMFPQRKQQHRDLNRFLDMLDVIIEEKRRKVESGENQNENLQENEKDLLTLMLESESKGEGKMENAELQSNLCIFFLAGHDTTANALSFAIYYLALNQDVQQRAREEAISILGETPEDVLPTLDNTKDMKYINQIMKEVLRINGPVNAVMGRLTTQDTELAGSFIPKGTRLTVNIFDTHHSDKNWADPLKFDPDRFEGEGVQVSGQGMSWVPFGNGSRQCIGMNFSLNEQRVMLSMLLRKYSWTLPSDSIHKDNVKTKGIGIVSPIDLHIDFKKRY